MSDRIASGEIFIEVNDRDAHARLSAMRADYRRTMEDIDGQEATAKVDADTSKLDRKIKEAREKVEKFAKAEAEVDLDADLKPLQASLGRAKAELAAFEKDNKPKVELDAEAARLKDQLKIARAELKQFNTEEAQARIAAEDEDFVAAYKATLARVKELDAQHADIDVQLKGYENVRKQIKQLEKDIDDLNGKAAQSTRDRIKAEEDLADAEAARSKAVAAHEQKAVAAHEKAVRDREKATAAGNRAIDLLEEQQYRKAITRIKRESRIREDAAKLAEQTKRGLGRDREEYDAGQTFHYQGYKGNLVRQLRDLSEARRKAGNDSKKLQNLEEREIRIRENLGRVTRKLNRFESFKQDDDRIAKELAEVPMLEAAYAKLASQVEDLNKKRKQAVRNRDQRLVYNIDADTTAAEAKMEDFRRKIRDRTGREPLVFNAVPRFSERAGARVRRDLANSLVTAVPNTVLRGGQVAGERWSHEFNKARERGLRGNASAIGGMAAGGLLRFGDGFKRFGEGLAAATVRIGPFTMTLRKALGAVAVLSPIVVDVVGALGALVGVAGSAAVGLGALSVAVVGGGVPAMLGMGLVIKDVVQEFTAVKKATKAYDDAVMKQGKNSDLAVKKQKELQRIMGGVSATTAKQVGSAQELGRAWDKATQPGRASVWRAAGQSIKAASDIMPMFAQRTNNALLYTQRGWSRWMKAISSSEGKAVLGSLMDNFNLSLKPAMAGLGQFVAYLAKVGAVAGRSLPGLATTFNRWSKGLNESTEESKKFVGGIHGVINSTKDVGNTFMSAGRLTKAFFGAGVRDGQSFAQTMTKTMDRWTAGFETPSGRAGLQHFFAESVSGAKALYGALAPIAQTFVGWARALSPAARVFFDVIGAIGSATLALASMTAMQGPLQALAATFAVIWGFGKIGAAASAITAFTRALFGMGAATAAAGRGAAASSAAQARQGAAAAGAAGSTARLAEAATVAGAAEARLAEGSGVASASLSRQVGAASAAAAAKTRLAQAAGAAALAEMRLAQAAGLANAAMGRQAGAMGLMAAATARQGAATAGLAAANSRAAIVGAAGAGRPARKATLPRAVPPVVVPPAATKGVQALTKAGGAARAAITGLGAAVLGTTGILGGAVVLTAAVGVGLYMYANRTRESEKATKRMNDAQKASQVAGASLMDGNLQLANSQLQVKQSSMDLRNTQKQANAEQRTMNRLAAAGKKGTQEYRDAQAQHKQTMLGLAAARLNDISTRRQATAAEKTERAAMKESTDQAQKVWREAGTRANAFKKEHSGMLTTFDFVKKAAAEAGMSVEEYGEKMDDPIYDKAIREGREYERLLKDQGTAGNFYRDAVARSVLANANLKRAMQGLGPMAESHARTFQKLGARIQNALTSSKNGTKYADPTKAASTANAASKAKTAGVSEKKIIDIIVNSKSAEQAIARLNRETIKNKLLDIKVNNVGDALAAIASLENKKLNDKVVKIMASDSDAKSKVAALKALGIPTKIAKMLGNNKDALAKAAQANGTSLRSLIQQILRQINNPGNLLANPPSLTQVINRIVRGGSFAGVKIAGPAAGTTNLGSGIETPSTRNHQERAFARASEGNIPKMSTTQAQRGQRFQGARMIVGEEPQYSETVISENPSYRKSNIEALKAAARALGVQMHGTGKGKKKFKAGRRANRGERSRAGGVAEKRVKNAKAGKKGEQHSWSSPSAEAQLNAVDAGFKQKAQKEFDIQRAEGKLKEPSTFTKVIGTDALGNDLVAVDQGAVDGWTRDLMGISTMYQELVDLIKNIRDVLIPQARQAVATAKKTAGENIGPLTSAIAREDDIINSKSKKNVAKDEARARKAVYVRELRENRTMFDNADEDLSSLKDRESTLTNEMTTAGDERDDYKFDADAVAGKASSAATDDSASYNKNAADQAAGTGDYAVGGQYGPPTPPSAIESGQTRLSDLDLEAQLSEKGMSFKGQPVRTKDAINADRRSQANDLINQGNAALVDTNEDGSLNTANDDEARSAISSGLGIISELDEAIKDEQNKAKEDALQQIMSIQALSVTLKDMIKANSNNITTAGMLGSSRAGSMVNGMGFTPGFGNAQTGGFENAGKTVNITNNYKTQPVDPHTWSQNMAFEAQVAL